MSVQPCAAPAQQLVLHLLVSILKAKRKKVLLLFLYFAKRLRDLNWQSSSHKTVSTDYCNSIYHETLAMITNIYFGRKSVIFMTKSPGPNRLTPLQQTVNNAKVRAFSSQTWLTGLNADLDASPLIRAETASRSVHSCVPRAEQDEQDSDLYQHQRSDRAHI